jgi:hypothetical protein
MSGGSTPIRILPVDDHPIVHEGIAGVLGVQPEHDDGDADGHSDAGDEWPRRANRDDRNDRPVPYDFIRPGGRGGNCFALAYRPGAEYLLLLRRGEHSSDAQPTDLTPYWASLSPTNEQLLEGSNDPWVVWVSQELRRQ